MSIRFLSVTAALLLVAGCGVSDRADDASDPTEVTSLEEPTEYPVGSTRIVKHFTDSSVPPKYHRSHTITIDAESTEIIVDSYGDEIGRDEVSTDPDEWARFLTDLPAALESLPDLEEPDDGCVGGTGVGLEVFVDDEIRFETYQYRCGGVGGERGAAIADLIAPLVTDLDPDT